jgi:arsenate reductase
VGKLNPIVVDVLKEWDIDIAGKKTKAVADLLREDKRYDYVVTVCDETSAERCPVFPGRGARLHWGFPDPSDFSGDWEARLRQTRLIRDQIRERIVAWLKQL